MTFAEDLSQVRTGAAPQVMASLRNLVISLHRLPEPPTSPPRYDITPATPGDYSTYSRSANFADPLVSRGARGMPIAYAPQVVP